MTWINHSNDHTHTAECALCERLVAWRHISRISPRTGRALCDRCEPVIATINRETVLPWNVPHPLAPSMDRVRALS